LFDWCLLFLYLVIFVIIKNIYRFIIEDVAVVTI